MARQKKRKDGRYSVTVNLGKDENGKYIRKNVYGNDPSEARRKAEILKANHNNVISVKDSTVYQTYLDKWFLLKKNTVEPSTYHTYTFNIEKIKTNLGKYRLTEIKPFHIQAFYNELLKTYSPNTILKIHSLIKESLDAALKNDFIVKNPAAFVDVPKKAKTNITPPQENAIDSILKALKGTEFEVVFILAGMLGLRRGELLALKWENVDLDKKVITIRKAVSVAKGGSYFKTPKSNEARTIYIQDNLIPVFERHKKIQFQNRIKTWKDNNLVVCQKNGKHYSPSHFSEVYKQYFTDNNLQFINLHNLRHYNATMMLKLGISDKMAANRLGHKQVSTLNEIYQHVIEDMEKEAAEKLNSLYKV